MHPHFPDAAAAWSGGGVGRGEEGGCWHPYQTRGTPPNVAQGPRRPSSFVSLHLDMPSGGGAAWGAPSRTYTGRSLWEPSPPASPRGAGLLDASWTRVRPGRAQSPRWVRLDSPEARPASGKGGAQGLLAVLWLRVSAGRKQGGVGGRCVGPRDGGTKGPLWLGGGVRGGAVKAGHPPRCSQSLG